MKTTETSMRKYPEFVAILYENLGDLVKLNLLFLLFSLPIVTAPAAYTAVTMSMQKLVRGEVRHVWDDFIATFRRTVWKSLIVGLLVFGFAALSIYTIPFYREQLAISPWFYAPLVLCCIVSCVSLMSGFYSFPMLAAVELPLFAIIKNSLILVFTRLWQSLLGLAVIAVITVIVIAALPVSLLLLVSFYFSLCCAIATFAGWGGILDYVLKLDEE